MILLNNIIYYLPPLNSITPRIPLDTHQNYHLHSTQNLHHFHKHASIPFHLFKASLIARLLMYLLMVPMLPPIHHHLVLNATLFLLQFDPMQI